MNKKCRRCERDDVTILSNGYCRRCDNVLFGYHEPRPVTYPPHRPYRIYKSKSSWRPYTLE